MGTGMHGGFVGTSGAKMSNAPVKTSGDVRYSKKKTVDYLLNPNHPQGGAKAKFFHDSLGYSQADSKTFHKNVVSSIIGKQPVKKEETKYGTKLTFKTTLSGKEGKNVSANVVVVIQKDKNRKTFKIVTVYPDKKEGKK